MLTLSGFAQVLEVMETKGRFRLFKLRTPEGFIFEGSLWTAEGHLEPPAEGELFSFSGFCPSADSLTLTAFRQVQGLDPARVPATTSSVAGTITSVEEDQFFLEYLSYNKDTRSSSAFAHTVLLGGDRWARRKAVLLNGIQVQVLGSLHAPSTTDPDDFWVFFSRDSCPSPVKKAIPNVFADRPSLPKVLVLPSDLEDDDPAIDLIGPSFPFSCSSSHSPRSVTVKQEGDLSPSITKGKGQATKRPRRG